MRRSRTWLGIGVVVAAGAVVAAVGMVSARNDAGPRAATMRVERGELVEVASVSGTIAPHAQVEVRSRTSGEVIEVAVAEGDRVDEGALLVRLDPVDAERALRAAQSEVRRLRAQLAQARAEVGVARAGADEASESERLSARGVELGLTSADAARQSRHARTVAAAQVQLRSAQATSAAAQLEAAEIALDEARRNVERTEIRAPFAGTVLAVDVERGAIVSSAVTNVAGGTALVTIADLSDLRVIGQLDEAQIAAVDVGQEVRARVDAYPDRSFAGRVARVSPLGRVDTNIVVFDVEIVVVDPDAALLRSGMSADVEIVTRTEPDALLVPLTAIRSRGARREVELATGERRAVRTGASDGAHIAILEGLEEGDEIVVERSARAGGGAPDRPRSLLPSSRRRGGPR